MNFTPTPADAVNVGQEQSDLKQQRKSATAASPGQADKPAAFAGGASKKSSAIEAKLTPFGNGLGKKSNIEFVEDLINIDGHDYFRSMPKELPKSIQKHPHWLVCNHEGRPVSRTGVGASKTTPADWADFQTVSKHVENDPKLWTYIVLTNKSEFTVFDVDFKPQKDKESKSDFDLRIERASLAHSRLQKMFPKRYEARSKSGIGFHIIVRGKFKGTGGGGPIGGEWSEVEIYTENHGIALTGHNEGGSSDPGTYDNETIQKIRDLIKAKPKDLKETKIPLKKNTQPLKTKTKSILDRKWTPEEIREMLATIPTRPSYYEWIKVISAVGSAVDELTALRLLQEWSPEETPGEYLEKLRCGLDQVGIGSLIRTAREHGWTKPILNEGEKARMDFFPLETETTGFLTTRASEITGFVETLDLVSGVLIIAAMSVVYGPSNCGKSFWCLYLAVCVAMGIPFFGNEVEKGAVIYFGLEGSVGIRNRIAAMKQEGILDDDAPLHLCFSALSLLDSEHADFVAQTVARVEKEEGCEVKLIVIDTYARAMAGGDENSGKDTSAVVATVDAIRAQSKAHVMLIHHCGKDEARGARGHSSLRAATDTEIEITRPDAVSPSVVSVKKQRDLPYAKTTCFTLVSVCLGTDSRGDPLTSCVVRHDEGCEVPPRKAGRPRKASEEDVLKLLPQKNTTAWQAAAKAVLNIERTIFLAHIKVLKLQNRVLERKGGGWEAKIQFPDQFPDHQILIDTGFEDTSPKSPE